MHSFQQVIFNSLKDEKLDSTRRNTIVLAAIKGIHRLYQSQELMQSYKSFCEEVKSTDVLPDTSFFPSLNDRDSTGSTALHYAAMRNSVEIAQALFEAEVDINAQDKNGNSALHLAAKYGHLDVLNLLLLRKEIIINLQNNNGDTALLFAYPEQPKAVATLMEAKADIDINNYRNQTLLKLAISYDLKFAKTLLQKDVKKSLELYGGEILDILIRSQQRDLARDLLDIPAVINNLKQKDSILLIRALRNNYYEIAHKLLTNDRIDVDYEQQLIEHNFELILRCNDRELTTKIISRTKALNTPGHKGITPLMKAIEYGSNQIAKDLIEHKVSLNRQDQHGNTALHYAASQGNLVIIRDLIAAGANFTLTNKDNLTPSALAAKSNQKEVADYLQKLEHQEKCNNFLKETKQSDYTQAEKNLLYAVAKGDVIKVSTILKEEKIHLTDRVFSLKLTLVALESGHSEVLKLLIRVGKLSVNHLDLSGQTLLMFGIIHGRRNIIDELIQAPGVDLDIQRNDGMTALILATVKNDRETLKKLLLNNAKADLVSHENKTAVDYASDNQHYECYKIFMDSGIKIHRNKLGFSEGSRVGSELSELLTGATQASFHNDELTIAHYNKLNDLGLRNSVLGDYFKNDVLKSFSHYHAGALHRNLFCIKKMVTVIESITNNLVKENKSEAPKKSSGFSKLSSLFSKKKTESKEIPSSQIYLTITKDFYEFVITTNPTMHLSFAHWVLLNVDAIGNPFFEKNNYESIRFSLFSAQKALDAAKNEIEVKEAKGLVLLASNRFERRDISDECTRITAQYCGEDLSAEIIENIKNSFR